MVKRVRLMALAVMAALIVAVVAMVTPGAVQAVPCDRATPTVLDDGVVNAPSPECGGVMVACTDGLDNDGDGLIDYGSDPGCSGVTDNDEYNAPAVGDPPPPPPPPPPGYAQCSDGQDNDGDGKWDYPADPGCTSNSDNDEYNAPAPPPPTTSYACSDGRDNDGDTLVDMNDLGCSSTTDNDEANPPPPADLNYYSGTIQGDPDIFDLVQIPAIGCAKVADGVNYTRPGRTLWRFAIAVKFCWNGATVTSVYGHDIVRTMNQPPWPLSIYQGWQSTGGFSLMGSSGFSSTNVKAEAHFEYCGAGFLCLNHQYPWIKINVTNRGQATCYTSAKVYGHTCARVAGP